MSEPIKCMLCGEPMPPGEGMFKFHGYSGPCPKPPKAVQQKMYQISCRAIVERIIECFNKNGNRGPRAFQCFDSELSWVDAVRSALAADDRREAAFKKLISSHAALLKEAKLSSDASGPCDHSVGICCCDLVRTITVAEEIINELNQVTSVFRNQEALIKALEGFGHIAPYMDTDHFKPMFSAALFNSQQAISETVNDKRTNQ